MLADREGRLEDRPGRIAHQALGYDRTADVGAMLDDLQRAGFIARYTACGKACIQILQFAKHQTPHVRETTSELPSQGQAPSKDMPEHNLGSAETSPRSPDSGFLIPDSGLGTAGDAAPHPSKKPRKTPIPVDFGISDRVRKWADSKGYGMLDEHLEALKRKVAANDYRKVSWDDFFMEAIREDWAKLRGRSLNGAAPGPDSRPVEGPDPALAKIEADRLKAAPIPENIRQQLQSLRGNGVPA
jgi:hypothetical protein